VVPVVGGLGAPVLDGLGAGAHLGAHGARV
jgi:hypothetical protein